MFGLKPDFFGQPFIVSVEKRDPVASGSRNTCVAGNTGAGIFLLDENNLITELTHYLSGGIRRPVIDDDHLFRRARLRQDAFDCPRDMLFGIIGRYDHTYSHRPVQVPFNAQKGYGPDHGK